ncbi:MAG: hypothetical protein WDM70_10435 [Nitrosomonadales bacterium]
MRDDALRQGRLILVVEDNETNQKVILRSLRCSGSPQISPTTAMQHWSAGTVMTMRWSSATCTCRRWMATS